MVESCWYVPMYRVIENITLQTIDSLVIQVLSVYHPVLKGIYFNIIGYQTIGFY